MTKVAERGSGARQRRARFELPSTVLADRSPLRRLGVPPCSVASRDASLFALDPPCARRRFWKGRDAGRPSLFKFNALRGVELGADRKKVKGEEPSPGGRGQGEGLQGQLV